MARRQSYPPYEPLGPTGSRVPIVAASVVGTLVVVGVGAALVLTLTGSGHPKAATVGAQPTVATPTLATQSATATGTAAIPTASPVTDLTPLQLDKPTTVTAGVPTGYQHTQTGAVTAAFYFNSAVGSTLNPDRAAVIGHGIADNSWTSASTDLATAIQGLRMLIGLPPAAQGDDGGAAAVQTPAAFQITGTPTEDTVDVLLLVHASAYNPAMPSLNRTLVAIGSVPVHWDGTDWRLMQPDHISDADRQRLTVDPLSATAASLGWRSVRA